MYRVIYLVLCVCFSLNAWAQADTALNISLLKKIEAGIKDFTADNLGNIYTLNASGQLQKLNDKGDSVAVFNDVRRYGQVFSIDATNPLKILVYYKDFSTIIVLDRLLNVRNTIDLRRQNIFQVRAVTSSYDNNIWLYDEIDSKLKKIDETGKILLETNDFRQVFDSVPSPTTMFDRDGMVYLYDPKKGLAIFDYYGALKNNIALKNISDLQVIDKNTITGRDSLHVIMYKPALLQLYSFSALRPLNHYKKILFSINRLYALNLQDELEIYTNTPASSVK
jgi:hypothetical protein